VENLLKYQEETRSGETRRFLWRTFRSEISSWKGKRTPIQWASSDSHGKGLTLSRAAVEIEPFVSRTREVWSHRIREMWIICESSFHSVN
jgi:hypothetical protein